MTITPPTNKEGFSNLVVSIETNTKNYRKALAFGICHVDRGQLNPDKILQATFPVLNFNENFGSFAIFCEAATLSGQELDFSANEWNIPVNEAFLNFALGMFEPFISETVGDKHLNIQVLQGIQEFFDSQTNLISMTEKSGIPEDIKNEISSARAEKLKNFYFSAIFADEPVSSVQAAYIKLTALSKGKVELRSLNLNGIFGALHNSAWSGNTPYEIEYLREKEIEMKIRGNYPVIDFVDKFPRYLQQVIPATNNVRILSTHNVRFGAQLAAGTTVMPGASYVNFNAGTTGASMVEGRISSSAVVGDGSDVGGGASILGVLSGTDGIPVTIGKNTLLGANSVTGIALGDGCIVDAGIAVLAGTKFKVDNAEWNKICSVNDKLQQKTNDGYFVCKGKDLVGLNGIHFRQDSITGAMMIRRSTREVKLNADLH
jgi:2,3,4,5-tetrahydropyridine-2-carboxylate N-succinyltransferase